MSGGVGGGGATPSPTRSVIFLGKSLAPVGRTDQTRLLRDPKEDEAKVPPTGAIRPYVLFPPDPSLQPNGDEAAAKIQ